MFLIFSIWALPIAAADSSWQFNLNVPIGDLTGFSVDNDSFGKYIEAWYGFLLGTIGIMATALIMWGGFKYLTSRGDKGTIDGAKTTIISAITGVVLAFGTYTLLALVNPALLKISMPKLPVISGGEGVNLDERDVAAGGGRSRITPATQQEIGYAGDDYDWNPRNALSGTTDMVNRATNVLNTMQANGQMPAGAYVSSGWRPGNGSSYHHAGMAIDLTWPGINQANAQEFVNAVTAIDPSLTWIIESDGENGSNWDATGMGVHLDIRPGNPYHET